MALPEVILSTFTALWLIGICLFIIDYHENNGRNGA